MGLLANASIRFGLFVLGCALGLATVICACTCYFDKRTEDNAPQKIRVFARLRRPQQLAPAAALPPPRTEARRNGDSR